MAEGEGLEPPASVSLPDSDPALFLLSYPSEVWRGEEGFTVHPPPRRFPGPVFQGAFEALGRPSSLMRRWLPYTQYSLFGELEPHGLLPT